MLGNKWVTATNCENNKTAFLGCLTCTELHKKVFSQVLHATVAMVREGHRPGKGNSEVTVTTVHEGTGTAQAESGDVCCPRGTNCMGVQNARSIEPWLLPPRVFRNSCKPGNVHNLLRGSQEVCRWSCEGEDCYNRVPGCWRGQEHRLSAKESFKHRTELSQDRGCVCHLWQGEGLLKSTGAYSMATAPLILDYSWLTTFPAGSGPCFGPPPHTHTLLCRHSSLSKWSVCSVSLYIGSVSFCIFLGANSKKTALGQDGTVKACGTLGWTNYILCYEMIISRLGRMLWFESGMLLHWLMLWLCVL